MISELSYVSPDAKLGKDVVVHPFAHIDANVTIGDGCEIYPYASIVSGTTLGNNVKVYQGSVIGADPQDFRWKGEPTYCVIGNDVTIREHVIINRSIYPGKATSVGDGCVIMAKVHIGHDTTIVGHSVIGNGAQVSGDVIIGSHAILSSNAIVYSGSEIGTYAMVKGGCRINGNVPPYAIIAHNPVVYAGVNAYLLRYKGFSEDTIDDIAKAYRHLYQSGTSVVNALKRIERDVNPSKERTTIIEFIRDHKLKIVAVSEHSEIE